MSWTDGPRSGDTYDDGRDRDRLNKQARAVFHALTHTDSEEGWVTLQGLSLRTGYPEASISARLRDLRKARFGSHIIERRYAGNGLHQYRYGGRQHSEAVS